MTIHYRGDVRGTPPLSASQYDETVATLARGSVNDGNAAGDGVTSDSAALQAVLDAGEPVRLDPAKTYLLTTRLSITVAGTGIEGNGATIKMSTASGHFDNATAAGAYGADAVAVYATGINNVFVKNVTIRPVAWVDQKYLRAIYFDDCDDALVENVEATLFSRVGGGVIEIDDCDRFTLRNAHVHHCYSNSTLNEDASTVSATDVQISGFVKDASASSGSADTLIEGCRFHNLTNGQSIFALRGYQTDGVSLLGRNAVKANALRAKVINCYFEQLGEGVDSYEHDVIVTGNTFKRCYGAGYVGKNGASRNLVRNNHAMDCGLTAYFLAASSLAGDLDANQVCGNFAKGGGVTSGWVTADTGVDLTGVAFTNPSVFRIDAGASDTGVVTNTWIDGNDFDGGGTVDFVMYMGSGASASPTHKYGRNLTKNAAVRRIKDDNSNLQFTDYETHQFKQLSAYVLTSTTGAQQVFNTSANGAFNAEAAAVYEVEWDIDITAMSGSSGDFSFGFGGTATFSRVNGHIEAIKATTGNFTYTRLFTTTPTPISVVAANTTTSGRARGSAIMHVANAGTIIPQIALGVAATASVSQESWCRFTRINRRTAIGDLS
jgi:hypothetical protein